MGAHSFSGKTMLLLTGAALNEDASLDAGKLDFIKARASSRIVGLSLLGGAWAIQ